MPLTNTRDDARVAKAVRYMNTFPSMTVPDAMKLAFSKEEQQCPAIQMWICRRLKKDQQLSITKTLTMRMDDELIQQSTGERDDNDGWMLAG